MPAVQINGGSVAYEVLGDPGAPGIVITPGGRFSMDVPGLRPLAEAVAAGGMKVLLWDRPNCGKSDIQFFGQSESHMRAETLKQLMDELDFGPCVMAGGSGGARDTALTVMLYPELATKLVMWNIVGGVYSTMVLAGVYVMPNIQTARILGLDAVMELPEWKALIEANPANRERFDALGKEEFLKVMNRWLMAFVNKPGQTLPGIEDYLFERITVPTMIIRGGENDVDHPKRTSLEVSCLIPQSQLIEPPWPEDAWEQSLQASFHGTGNIFDPWRLAAPAILDFALKG